jgi:hypothetical protein
MDDREREEEGRAKRARDLTDFNNELADRDVGRMRRFLPCSEAPAAEGTRQGENDRFFWKLTLRAAEAVERDPCTLAETKAPSSRLGELTDARLAKHQQLARHSSQACRRQRPIDSQLLVAQEA